MSWKSLVTAGLLCVLASPVFAAPTLNMNLVGLNSAGNWIWQSTITPTGSTSPLAAEIGFRSTTAGADVLSASKNAATWDTDNPGTTIFGWETLTPAANNNPVGLQTNAATDEVFSALGSVDNVTGTQNHVEIIVARPTATRLNTAMQWLGKYGAGTVNGRIAELDGGGAAVNYDTYAGTATKGVRGGNANLSAMVDVGDLAILGGNYNQLTGTKRWQDADFTGDGNVDVGDLAVLGANYNQADANWSTPGFVGGAGSGLGAGSAVPEPSTLLMLVISGMFAGCFRRHR